MVSIAVAKVVKTQNKFLHCEWVEKFKLLPSTKMAI